MFGAAEALAAVAKLMAAIPAAAIAVFVMIVAYFTMYSFLFPASERELALSRRHSEGAIARRQRFQTLRRCDWAIFSALSWVNADSMNCWADDQSSNLNNIGTTLIFSVCVKSESQVAI
jgi:hypothetical protein